jgi:hypothetical protein
MKWIALALSVAGAVVTAGAYRTASTSLAAPLARTLERGLTLPEGAVTIADARLELPASLRIRDARLGRMRIGDLALAIDPIAALAGEGKLRHGRITLHDVALPHVSAAEVGIEIESGRLTRVAFAAASVESAGRRLSGLAGALWREPATATDDGRTFRLRAARPGLVVTGRYHKGALEARLELDKLALAWLQPADKSTFELSRAIGTGIVAVRGGADGLWARGQLTLADVGVHHPSIAHRAIGPFTLSLDGDARVHEGRLTVEKLELSEGPIALTLAGSASVAGDFDVEAELDRIGCGKLLASLPRDLLPALDGLTVDGELAGRAQLRGSIDRPADLKLAVETDVGCKVLGDPPLADPHTLAIGKGPVTVRALDAAQAPRPFVIGSANPSFRNLSSLKPDLLKAFVAAEDGRFFQHHGFDLDMIRRALAADLASGRFDRGASTLSQQTVKNLFLSGERTAARKVEEAVLTWRMEQLISKRRILELYLNLVELGPGVYGVGEAAERYFGKEPEELSLDEAAQLAALLPAPRHGMDAAWQRRYQSLITRLPSEIVVIPESGDPPKPVKLTRR